MTVGFLHGEPVPPEWTNWLLRDWLAGGFHLRMDARRIYLYFGHEDLVVVLPRLGRSMELTSRTLTSYMYRHCLRRKVLARTLASTVGEPKTTSQ